MACCSTALSQLQQRVPRLGSDILSISYIFCFICLLFLLYVIKFYRILFHLFYNSVNSDIGNTSYSQIVDPAKIKSHKLRKGTMSGMPSTSFFPFILKKKKRRFPISYERNFKLIDIQPLSQRF